VPPLLLPIDAANSAPYFRYWSFLPGRKESRFSIETAPVGAEDEVIQERRGPERVRSWEVGVRSGVVRKPVRGGMSDGAGWSSLSFFWGKSFRRREGTPAWRVKVCWICGWRIGGRGSVEGVMRRMSQCMFWARSSDVEMLVGRIIQRITRAMVRGLREVFVWMVVRNWERGVLGVRERRWIVQIGIMDTRIIQ